MTPGLDDKQNQMKQPKPTAQYKGMFYDVCRNGLQVSPHCLILITTSHSQVVVLVLYVRDHRLAQILYVHRNCQHQYFYYQLIVKLCSALLTIVCNNPMFQWNSYFQSPLKIIDPQSFLLLPTSFPLLQFCKDPVFMSFTIGHSKYYNPIVIIGV